MRDTPVWFGSVFHQNEKNRGHRKTDISRTVHDALFEALEKKSWIRRSSVESEIHHLILLVTHDAL